MFEFHKFSSGKKILLRAILAAHFVLGVVLAVIATDAATITNTVRFAAVDTFTFTNSKE